jgi:predicted glycoside hydrolase/deacetylase ChbG (UPF0249 family)
VRALARRVQVGVHVTLVGEPWLTRALLFKSWSTLLPWLALPGRQPLLEAEVHAQVRAMVKAGVTPAHLDSHQHVHVMPRIWPVVERVAREHGIGRIRIPATPDRRIAKRSLGGIGLQRLAQSRHSQDSLACIGIAHAGHNTAADGVDVELVAHPGIHTAALQSHYASWRFDWRTEQAALLSPEWGAACTRLGYDIAAPSLVD